MPLLARTVTYKKFRVSEALPVDFKDTAAQNLGRHAFREIDPKSNPELSHGWVNAFDYFDTRLGLEKVIFGQYIILGTRRDRKSLSGAVLKARTMEALRESSKERRGKKLNREELIALRETVKIKLLNETSSVSNFYEMVWNYETQDVYFSSQSGKAVIEFVDMFEATFKVPLDEVNLVSRAEDYLATKGLDLDTADLESAHWGA